MTLIARVKKNFEANQKAQELALRQLPAAISMAGKMLFHSLAAGNKIISCGNGGSACDAEHFTAELVGRFQKERKGLAAITLNANIGVVTAIANDYVYSEIFAKQLIALGKAGDVLLVISTSGNSINILQAINVAHELNLKIVALTGGTGGKIRAALHPEDIEICVSDLVTARIQEMHILIIHCLCDLIDFQLLL